jgi:hypothetical protein
MAGMADDDLFFRPEHWRKRAKERLAMARNAKEPRDRERLLKVARSYQRLAVRAQDWKAAREDQPPYAISGQAQSTEILIFVAQQPVQRTSR